MNARIEKLTELTLAGKMFVEPISMKFDRMDIFLSQHERNAKQICEYILHQEPKITEYSCMTGFFNFDGSVVGDLFNRLGHEHSQKLLGSFYCKKIDNISALDWQHGTSDYRKVLRVGVRGIAQEIESFLSVQTDPEKKAYLTALHKIADCLVLWIHKCVDAVRTFAETLTDAEQKQNFAELAQALVNISERPPMTFYEAILTIYVCFSMNPDSYGTLDRYLSPFYFKDVQSGALTREKAKIYLQEFFLMVQAETRFESLNFTKGGNSHFCVGGRDEEGKDCYNEVSDLIIESLTELPTYIPEVTLRWTQDTPKDVFRRVLRYERNDKYKRIAFTNDDKRIRSYTQICGFPYKEAINYTLVGCNEPAMLGGMCASTSHANLAYSIAHVLHQRSNEIEDAETFDAFYAVFKDQLYRDLDKIYYYDDQYNLVRSKDVNYVSSLFMNGCVENGKSSTQGGANYAVSTIMFLGNVTTIDSLAIIKQFVFDEKILSFAELIQALRSDWKGYEELRRVILSRGNFFGNDDDTSNFVARKFYDDLYEYVRNKKTVFGYPVLLGDHTGYPSHFKWFGEGTAATPDGRYSGEPLTYGISQTNHKARNGLTALMNAIAKFDPHGISGATVTNFHLDASYGESEEKFEKTADLFETYFKNGGMQFQLNYLDHNDLIDAKANPQDHGDLRVRVTGYSDFFCRLKEETQDSIIRRYKSE